MPRIVDILPKTRADVRRSADWLRLNRSMTFASRWNERMIDAIVALAEHCERYPEADESADLGINLRYKMHGRRPYIYRILFTNDESIVTVHRILHAAHDRLTIDDL